ncbi:MAG: queuosine precursor transporter [Anaerolineaceae bacterium]|nr:queuosine precursor transporter [Anaerolineaceae bacterium]
MLSQLLISSFYIAAQMISDIASLRIISLFGVAIDGGTLIYPITFTLRDMLHKVAGVKTVRIIILTAAGLNLVMAGYFWLVSRLPSGDISQPDFASVLAPVWRIVFASIIAEVISEFIDTEIYQFWVEKVTRKYQWSRVLISNTFSTPVDSLIFTFIAFYGVLPNAILLQIFFGNIVIKWLTSLISIPGIYLVKEKEA